MTFNHPAGYSYLAERFPAIGRRLPRLPIGDFPTPLHGLGNPRRRLWVKRDDRTHPVYGGNKIRKLEYLLGSARSRGSEDVVTFGGVGSNHVLATAIHAGSLGVRATGLMLPQRMTDYVRGTLERHQQIDSRLLQSPAARAERIALMRALRDAADHGLTVVPLGGTSPRGSIGYVNAALELATQWTRPNPPERIYVAAGTMGTAAGLAVGVTLLGWPTEIHAVRVTAPHQVNEAAMRKLAAKTARLLEGSDERVPVIEAPWRHVTIRTEYLGEDYADTTPESQHAVDEAMRRWRLPLETTYTGKAMACMLDDIAAHPSHGDWLFWHTYNGRAAPRSAASERLAPEYSDLLALCR